MDTASQVQHRFVFSRGGYDTYAGDTLADTLAEVASHKLWRNMGDLAIVWDGDIAHYCGWSCLRSGIDSLSTRDQFLNIVSMLGILDRSLEGELDATLIVDSSAGNVWCDNCHEQIGTHFGECVFCEAELMLEPGEDGSACLAGRLDSDSSETFAGICEACRTGADSDGVEFGSAGWADDADDDERAEIVDRLNRCKVAAACPNDADMIVCDDEAWHAIRSLIRYLLILADGQTDLWGPPAFDLFDYRANRVWSVAREFTETAGRLATVPPVPASI